jgi:hypothetical protein
MLDDMFSFVEPILEPTEDSFSEFVTQLDAFFDLMEGQGTPVAVPRPLNEETYKEMWMLRYQQHLGKITFLELLDKYEEMLGIAHPQDSTGT